MLITIMITHVCVCRCADYFGTWADRMPFSLIDTPTARSVSKKYQGTKWTWWMTPHNLSCKLFFFFFFSDFVIWYLAVELWWMDKPDYKINCDYSMPHFFFPRELWRYFPESLASVAQLDAHPTGDQEVACPNPTRSATFYSGDWSWNIFYGHSLPSADSRRASVSFWQKNAHNTD